MPSQFLWPVLPSSSVRTPTCTDTLTLTHARTYTDEGAHCHGARAHLVIAQPNQTLCFSTSVQCTCYRPLHPRSTACSDLACGVWDQHEGRVNRIFSKTLNNVKASISDDVEKILKSLKATNARVGRRIVVHTSVSVFFSE